MNGWIVLGLALLALFLLGQVRVGVRAEYSQAGPQVWARLGPAGIKVFPRPPKGKTKPKKEVPKADELKRQAVEESPKKGPVVKKLGGPLELVRNFLPLVLEAAGQFKRKLRVDILFLELTVGGDDPADAALLYGRANALLGSIWGPLTHAFRVKDGRARTQIDFNSQATTIYGTASFSLKVGQILWLALYFGTRALVRFLKLRRAARKKAQQQRKAV